MNILITGATGFIGKHLANTLSNGSHSIRCLVRKSSKVNSLKNIGVSICYGDLLVKDSLRQALEEIDVVYHLAGEVYSRKKDDYYKGNILATNNLLAICKEKGINRIIYLSSVGVYKPKTDKTLLTEESICDPITYYGKTKLYGERLLKEYNVPFVIVRAPVIYGPSQPAVLNKFFLDGLNKQKMYVVGDGNNLRSLCYIDNLIEGLILLSEKSDVDSKTFLFSDDTPYTFNEIITCASKVVKHKITTIYFPSILGDISWRINNIMGRLFNLYFVELYSIKTMQLNLGCDITKAKKEIGFNPTVTLEAGIKNTIEWIKNSQL